MEQLFEQIQDDTQAFWQNSASGVRRLDKMPSPADFFRDYVATSTPVVISGGASSFLKTSHGSWDDLPSLAGRGGSGNLEVTVDFTPNGRGDCVVEVPHGMLSGHSDDDVNGNDSSRGDAAGEVGVTKEESSGRGSSGKAVDAGGVGGVSESPPPAAAPEVTLSTAGAGTTAVFVKPEERRMRFEAFIDMLSAESGSGTPGGVNGGEGVPYLSHQVLYICI